MMTTHGLLALLPLMLAGTPSGAAEPAQDRCAAMNYMLSQARTAFPELAHYKVNAGRCSLVRQEYKCEWAFTGDRYQAAKDQAARLVECTAAQHGATKLEGKRDEIRYQINPETSVLIRGPRIDSGDWTLMLRIDSTADWN